MGLFGKRKSDASLPFELYPTMLWQALDRASQYQSPAQTAISRGYSPNFNINDKESIDILNVIHEKHQELVDVYGYLCDVEPEEKELIAIHKKGVEFMKAYVFFSQQTIESLVQDLQGNGRQAKKHAKEAERYLKLISKIRPELTYEFRSLYQKHPMTSRALNIPYDILKQLKIF